MIYYINIYKYDILQNYEQKKFILMLNFNIQTIYLNYMMKIKFINRNSFRLKPVGQKLIKKKKHSVESGFGVKFI